MALWQRGVQGFLALWLGLLVPLLCVPGMSSNHTHGIHWVWEQGGVASTETTTHHHDHSYGDAHSHSHTKTPAPAKRPTVVFSFYPTISSNQIPIAELLMNLFGMMEPVPNGISVAALMGLVLVVASGWLFRAVPPLPSPWNPPKSYS
jgi:4-amino-4-deoxy-L-arabinose transferase-like glycosyltransferase